MSLVERRLRLYISDETPADAEKKAVNRNARFSYFFEFETRLGYRGVVASRGPGAYLCCYKSSFCQHFALMELTSLTDTRSTYSSGVLPGTMPEWRFDLLRTEGLFRHAFCPQA